MLISRNKLNPPKTIYVIQHADILKQSYNWCYLDQIFYNKRQARCYCITHSIPTLLIKKVTIRDGKRH